MTDDTTSNLIKSGVELAKAIPIYQDLLQPASKEMSKGLEVVARSVNMALSPLAALVWGYDQIRDWLTRSVAEKLKDVPENDVQTPDLNIVGPAVEALRFAAGSETLREMYAKLIATAMTKQDADKAHPTFVEILKQLSPDEGKIIMLFRDHVFYPYVSVYVEREGAGLRDVMKHWSDVCHEANCDLPAYAPVYLENLERLSIVEFHDDAEVEPEHYEKLQNADSFRELIAELEMEGSGRVVIEKGLVSRTMLGQVFIDACIGETTGSQAKLKNVESR